MFSADECLGGAGLMIMAGVILSGALMLPSVEGGFKRALGFKAPALIQCLGRQVVASVGVIGCSDPALAALFDLSAPTNG
jgi:hypothetical protein